ncbi:MAG: MGH1-like glycoside hydrolase domain-containing protein [Candidatus Dormibacteria bacterium]
MAPASGPSGPAGPEDRWRLWGPYLSLRQWGTVREDYSADGDAWAYLPFEQARSRAYRWGEDGILGISDRGQRVCLGLALWNGRDPVLKERFFGLSNAEGSHGEDVKEYWHYLDGLPGARYLRALYRYPMEAFPFEQLRRRNRGSGPELGLLQLGAFDGDRYWTVEVEYAKAEPTVVAWRVRVTNQSSERASLHLLPQVWLRNTWAWERGSAPLGTLRARGRTLRLAGVEELPGYRLQAEGDFQWLCCDNETNSELLFGGRNRSPYPKDAIGDAVLQERPELCNRDLLGTKVALHYRLELGPGESGVVRLLWGDQPRRRAQQCDAICQRGLAQAERYYARALVPGGDADDRLIQRQALAGLIWSQQYYEYDVPRWLAGDPTSPAPPAQRLQGRNHDWSELRAADVIVMPDSWEYPWFASWDLAFHALALEPFDVAFAKEQLLVLLQPHYLREDGQLPAYEWAFSDSNPPVHALAVWQLYIRDRNRTGVPDRAFLEQAFLALLFHYGWWVNRRDPQGMNIFSGGFLGLDNISAVDRSHLPAGASIAEADATAWMGLFVIKMFRIAAELAIREPQYENMALRFFGHFTKIAAALNGNSGRPGLWDERDGFYYDLLRLGDGQTERLRLRSLVGLMPLAASEVVHRHTLQRLPKLAEQLDAATETGALHYRRARSSDPYACLSLVGEDRIHRLLDRLLDPAEFLSGHGPRSLSKAHLQHPFKCRLVPGMRPVRYEPGVSRERVMGGNSNWRGPVWFPTTYVLVQALRLLGTGLGPGFTHPFPAPGGPAIGLSQIADQLASRTVALFRRGRGGRRPLYQGLDKFQKDPEWNRNLLFYEYFDGDSGAGHGAAHQTGWTALAALLVEELRQPWLPPQVGGSRPRRPR